jgi:CSLREA domain-containing protein
MPTMRRLAVVPILAIVTSVVLIALTTFSSPHSAQGIPFPTLPPLGVALVVNTSSDMVDPGDGTCSLRAAIEATNANAHAGNCDASASQAGATDGITFDIGTGTPAIDIGSTPLPAITDKLEIDGHSGGADRVEIRGPGGSIISGHNVLTIDPTAPGSIIEHLVIDNSEDDGIMIEAANVTLLGNFIGTDATGTTASPNQGYGVHVTGNGVRIGGVSDGGPCSGDCNLISGNFSGSIFLDNGESGAVIKGNFLGPDINGTKGFELLTFGPTSGVYTDGSNDIIGGASGTTPGGACTGDCNLISGNGNGVLIAPVATGTQILGNFIGIDVTGVSQFFGSYGIWAKGPGVIGGTNAAARNVVSGNLHGIQVDSGNVTIEGNFIGTNSAGTAPLGNAYQGIILTASGTVVGGSGAGAGNVISGNGTAILAQGAGATGATIEGNIIGPQADGISPLGNSSFGVALMSGASGNLVGGIGLGEGNLIRSNGFSGVYVSDAGSLNNAIRGNSIDDNGHLGIELANGGNGGQAAPALNSAENGPDGFGGTETRVQGMLSSTPNETFMIDFYVSPACDPSGAGEGRTWQGASSATTDGSGMASVDSGFSPTADAGQVITTTATDPGGNTSEFSNCATVVGPTPTPSPSSSPSPTPTPTPSPTPTPVVTPTPTPVGTSRIWGDVDCGGDIAPRDAQAILKNVLVQNALSQTQPCPAVGSQVTVDGVNRIWGDVDCGGIVAPRDAQAVLKNVLAQNALSQTQPCPAVASTVQVVG